jgi:dTMP kinase
MQFITFEGGEGSGKTTQSKMLFKSFQDAGIKSIWTREPGGTESAELIRQLLVTGEIDKWHPVTELLLHNAARNEHVAKLIQPNIKEGKVVICDRFVDSTMAYQGFGHKLGRKLPAMLHNITMEGVSPELTFILDIDPEIGLARTNQQGENNRYEKFNLEFHQRVRKGFQEIGKLASGRCITLDAQDTVDHIHKKIINIINEATGLDLKPVALEMM